MEDPTSDLIAKLEEREGESITSEEIELVQKEVESLPVKIPVELSKEEEPVKEPNKESGDLRVRIQSMKFVEKIKLALLGNKQCRGILVYDKNKIIQQLVLRNPRLSEGEVEEFARNPNMSEQVLRRIGDGGDWIKGYAVKVALVNNPKTPPTIALKWLRYINATDLKKLAKSKNVPQLVSTYAKKRVSELEA